MIVGANVAKHNSYMAKIRNGMVGAKSLFGAEPTLLNMRYDKGSPIIDLPRMLLPNAKENLDER